MYVELGVMIAYRDEQLVAHKPNLIFLRYTSRWKWPKVWSNGPSLGPCKEKNKTARSWHERDEEALIWFWTENMLTDKSRCYAWERSFCFNIRSGSLFPDYLASYAEVNKI
jgi:hypothetical protein